LPPRATITVIPKERATTLAHDAMSLAHTLLSTISNKSANEIKDTFTSWFEEEGRAMLKLDGKSARDFLGEDPDNLADLLEEHPSSKA